MPDASIASGFGIYITIWYALLQTIIYRWYFITTYLSSHLLKFFQDGQLFYQTISLSEMRIHEGLREFFSKVETARGKLLKTIKPKLFYWY